jgi:deoxyribose-phosphate aldolase
VQLCCPIGFPQGVTLPEVKQFEAETALKLGARELDMTINIGALKSRRYDLVERDIAGVVEVARRFGASVKTIIETCLLTDDEKVAACQIAERAGASFIKTSTGCQAGGATVEDVRLLRAAAGPNVIIKASGQVSDIEKALALYEAGARRFGTSSTISILEGLRRKIEEQSRG